MIPRTRCGHATSNGLEGGGGPATRDCTAKAYAGRQL
jgi:hypothetical protein